MEWIQVERKLPGSGGAILIAAPPYVTIAHWNEKERHFDFLSREDEILLSGREISYWMPLPESPQERHNDWDRELRLCDGVNVITRLPGTPVEYTGDAFDKKYYFRSRGERWRMAIADTIDQAVEADDLDNPLRSAEFFCTGRYSSEEFAAGYMPIEQAEEIIRRCVRLWRAGKKEPHGATPS
jgi:hypothetical protein